MKKSLPLITFTLLLFFFGCRKDHIDGPGKHSFMEKLAATFHAEGGEELINAENVFFSIQYLTIIQAGDTLRQKFSEFIAGEQTISGSWFTVETIGYGANTLPNKIKVTARANTTGAERQLIFTVWNGERGDKVTITQSQDS
ncbi:BACON domain-containing carbohydrate-binding protein [Maribellus sp. YY47]|uniref:BACON domain-containing protein n=1 Tax=Maribellus sp. YY47 TaxID=2929486 RepID=UPI00200104BC|nr:BACON domain-containing carbohydrate-binding protein [Maribellus sp. YY47]MCK3684279.1 hypothetical protein [Maribellus sp. YY47]